MSKDELGEGGCSFEGGRFIKNVVERHGHEKAEEIFQRMADDVVGYEDLGRVYLEEMFRVLGTEKRKAGSLAVESSLQETVEWLDHFSKVYSSIEFF